MKVKICGIMSADDAVMCESFGADALGFVHFPGRKRSIPIDLIKEIVPTLGPMLTKVLVCAPRTSSEAIELGTRANVDVIQLYTLDTSSVLRIKAQGFRVIRAFTPQNTEVAQFKEVADAILFDGSVPGSGQAYDYSTVPIKCCRRVIIAGGLTVNNLHIAKALNPYALDVSSGVEQSIGKKDPKLVSEFIRRCKL